MFSMACTRRSDTSVFRCTVSIKILALVPVIKSNGCFRLKVGSRIVNVTSAKGRPSFLKDGQSVAYSDSFSISFLLSRNNLDSDKTLSHPTTRCSHTISTRFNY